MSDLRPRYLETVNRIERLHRQLLDLIGVEFDRMGWEEINPTQAMLLANIGDQKITVGDVHARGIYLGSNASYNIKKLTAGLYLRQERSSTDGRVIWLSLTPKGEEVAEVVGELHARFIEAAAGAGLDLVALDRLNAGLQKLARLWTPDWLGRAAPSVAQQPLNPRIG